MSADRIAGEGLAGVDASGLDHEWREEIQAEIDAQKSGPLGRLGTSEYIKVIPEYYRNQQRKSEE